MSENTITIQLLTTIKIDAEEPWNDLSSLIIWTYLITLDELNHLSEEEKRALRRFISLYCEVRES